MNFTLKLAYLYKLTLYCCNVLLIGLPSERYECYKLTGTFFSAVSFNHDFIPPLSIPPTDYRWSVEQTFSFKMHSMFSYTHSKIQSKSLQHQTSIFVSTPSLYPRQVPLCLAYIMCQLYNFICYNVQTLKVCSLPNSSCLQKDIGEAEGSGL